MTASTVKIIITAEIEDRKVVLGRAIAFQVLRTLSK